MSKTLGESQELFVRLEAEWVLWALAALPSGFRLRHGEGRINQRGAKGAGRRARLAGRVVYVEDAVHMDGGTHYLGTGADWNLIGPVGPGGRDALVEDGEHPAWVMLGEGWEKKHELCRWGGRFGDANHISVTFGGKS